MRVLVFGAGAIGSVLGGFLAKSGHQVTLLGRPWHLDVVRREGLRISGIWGTHHIRTMTTAVRWEELFGLPPFDWVFVCVKAHQTRAAAAALASHLDAWTLACAFQNGFGNDEALTEHIPPSRVALGRVIFGVELTPGHAHITVCADDVVIGAPDQRVSAQPLAMLVAALKASGIPCRATSDIVGALWAKLLYNCALNGLSTVLEVPYGKLLEHEACRRLMREVIEEAYRVAAARRVVLEPPTAEGYYALLQTTLIPNTAAHHASMLQDIQRGRPTEIDAMNGAVARLGEETGVATPANALITRLVHAKERFAGVAGEQDVPGG